VGPDRGFGVSQMSAARGERHEQHASAIYARVSTIDQEPENQLAELRHFIPPVMVEPADPTVRVRTEAGGIWTHGSRFEIRQ
jgi:hypothetical protein